MLAKHEWFDVGMSEDKCRGNTGQPTCHTKAEARETRIDYLIANPQLMAAITKCEVDNTSSYPTHRPLSIEIETGKLERETTVLQKPTNFAKLFEEAVKTRYEQQEEISNDVNNVRQELNADLHEQMGQHIMRRFHRIAIGLFNKDTTSMWG